MENWSVINRWLKCVCDYLATVTIDTKLDYLKLSDVVEEKYNRHHPFMATLKVMLHPHNVAVFNNCGIKGLHIKYCRNTSWHDTYNNFSGTFWYIVIIMVMNKF